MLQYTCIKYKTIIQTIDIILMVALLVFLWFSFCRSEKEESLVAIVN